jgi:ankyrin repeat protein
MVQIDRLLNDGTAIDAEAPAPLPQGQPAAGLGQLFPGGLPQLAMTPLLAAVIHQQQPAAERLLAGGADPNYVHPLFGTPLHAATGAGNVDLLRLLIDRGGDVRARNRQGQTPLAVVAASRATIERLAQAQAMVKSLGVKLPAILEGLSSAALPTAGWDACERLLQQRGAT